MYNFSYVFDRMGHCLPDVTRVRKTANHIATGMLFALQIKHFGNDERNTGLLSCSLTYANFVAFIRDLDFALQGALKSQWGLL
jgi:hypothetical protein